MMNDSYHYNVYGDNYLFNDFLPAPQNRESVKTYIEQKIKDYRKCLETCRQVPTYDPCDPIRYYPNTTLDIHICNILSFLKDKLTKLKAAETNGKISST